MAQVNLAASITSRRWRLPLILMIVLAGVMLFSASCAPAAPAEGAAVSDISPSEYQSQYISTAADHLLIDVRTPEEFASGHIAGAINISVETIADRLNEIPQGQTLVLYCRSGNRSAQAAQILAEAGYTDIHDLGGINDWVSQGYPTVQ